MLLCLFVYLLISFVILRLSLAIYHRYWNPLFLFYIMLTFGVLSSVFGIKELKIKDDELENGILWLSIGSFLLSISFLTAQMRRIKVNKKRIVQYKKSALSKLTTVCLIISIAQLCLSYITFIELADGDITRLFIENASIRADYLTREDGSPIVTSLGVILGVNFRCLLCLFPEAIKQRCRYVVPKLIIILLMELASSVLTMSKEAFLMVCILLISAYSIQLNTKKLEIQFIKKYSIFFAILIVSIILLTSIQRNYTDERYDNYFYAVTGTIYGYIGMPVSAFCALASFPSAYFGGSQCFRPFYNILSHLGIVERISIIQDPIRGNVNVYSMFGNMYNDFGFAGIIFLSIIIGILLGLLYYVRQDNRICAVVTNSVILMTMFWGYYDFKLIQTVYPFTIIYVYIIERLLRKKIYLINNEK